MNIRRVGVWCWAVVLLLAPAVVLLWGQVAAAQDVAAPTVQATLTPESSLQIQETVICQQIDNRTPLAAGDVFSSEVGALYCYTRVLGAGGETRITHNWYYQGALKASIQLPVRAATWRTWSKKTIPTEWTGEWMVEVLDEKGSVLDSVIFHVQ